ncbi:GNAT family N-acetyltransferase [Nocardioides sp. WV_118_6]|uniref:GNAT family N-acetyltransferase n=1 Tax=Nocardioides simplex TaxID=2045 RepID=UPI00214FB334|nr:GNAT family N-acetyltransferase [Pimelobacter simplex]UUW87345.1 GNAT family N-acetyltransferase [Pimelobacter simplex]UUW96850.1 GNAT family N-acetyltransferase [Pimelobacter simplex]
MPLRTAVAVTTEIAHGSAAELALADLASYVDGRSNAFSTGAGWLRAAARHLPGQPLTIALRGADGRVLALAPLVVQRRAGVVRIEVLGGELNDYAELFHDDPVAADLLADAVASWVRRHRRWSLRLSQLAPGDPVVAGLVARLPGAVVVPGPPMPRIEGAGTDYRLTRHRRRKINTDLNRLAADGYDAERLVVDDPVTLERWLPRLVDVRRGRDHGSGRRSHLDDDGTRAFHEEVVRDAMARGRAVVDLLVVGDEVLGFTTTLRDGPVSRLFDGRVAQDWMRYRGGIVCEMAAVQRAVADPAVETFDWLRGRTDAKFGNAEIHRVELQAASHAWIERMDERRARARAGLKALLPAALVRRIVQR